MPPEANVFVMEDKEEWQLKIEKALNRGGHQVVIKATSLEKAITAVERLGELDVSVAVLDCALTTKGREGDVVAEMIRARHPYISIIGFSRFGVVTPSEVNLGKGRLTELADIVTEL